MATVSLKNVSKLYPGGKGEGRTAVNDLTLEIQDREFVTLAGPRHCGLSSVIRMIAGLDDPTKGDILIGDRRVNDVSPKERDVALVSRNHALYPGMSLYDNLAFGLKRRKFPPAEMKKRVLAAAEIFGLQELLEEKSESFSMEQRQRIALARAVALQSKVFLFDEPWADLEATVRGQMQQEVMKLHQRLQATMVYATHDPVEAMALGGRMVVLHEGTIQQEGLALTLYDEPASVFVAGFLGHPPMNLISGALKQDRDGFLFSEGGEGTIEIRLPAADFLTGQEFAGRSVLLGVRPEEIGMADSSRTEKLSGVFPAIIDHVEQAGGETNLSLQTGAHILKCRVPGKRMLLEAGQRGRFQLNLSSLHLFDPVSSHRIGEPS